MLFSIGIFTILIGFLLIIIGIALGMFQESKSRHDYSKRTETFGRETHFENTPDSEESIFMNTLLQEKLNPKSKLEE